MSELNKLQRQLFKKIVLLFWIIATKISTAESIECYPLAYVEIVYCYHC